jgi:hypothetical protein
MNQGDGMRKVWMTLGVGLFAVSAVAMGPDRKPGLWEVTTTMTWIQSPFPNGMTPPSTPRTTKVCVTQEAIDKFGGITPQSERGDCTVSNVQIKPSGVSADMVCTGQMNGKGGFEATFVDADHTNSSVHFTGSIAMGPNSRPVEWKTSSSSTFVSSDCGSVKPPPMPKQ